FHAPLPQAFTVPANFAGSLGFAGTVPTSDAVFEVGYVRAGTYHTIGHVTFAASDAALTLSAQAAVALLAGDILRLNAPDPQDATLADCGVTILLKRA